MNRKIFNYFEIAANLARKKNDLDKRAYFIGAIAIRGDGTMVSAVNGSDTARNRQIHCEYRICKKIDHGATVYLARIGLSDGKFRIAKPCRNCRKVLRSKKVKKVYYTIGPNEYGVLYL